MEISVIFSQMVQLFLILFIGYVLFKIDVFNKDTNRRLTKLVLYIALPSRILSSVLSQTERPPENLVITTFVIAIIMYLALPLMSFLLVKLLRLPKADQGIYMYMSTYGNVGFMGFPIIEAVFGEEALFYAAIFNIIFNISCFSVGILILHYGSSEKASVKWKALITPNTIVATTSIIIYALNLKFPAMIANTVQTLGSLTTPLAMMLIGSTLATMNVRDIFSNRHIYPFAIIRQFILPLLLWPLLSFLIPDRFLLGITFMLFIMPAANNCVMMAIRYDANEQLAAKTVFITTVMTIVTIPLLLYICY